MNAYESLFSNCTLRMDAYWDRRNSLTFSCSSGTSALTVTTSKSRPR